MLLAASRSQWLPVAWEEYFPEVGYCAAGQMVVVGFDAIYQSVATPAFGSCTDNVEEGFINILALGEYLNVMPPWHTHKQPW